MGNRNNGAAVVFAVVVWITIMLCIASRVYNQITGPDGLQGVHFKNVEDLLNGRD